MSFSPADVPDLWAWYDAGQGVTGGTSVTAWEDQSGNGNDLTAVSGEEPEFVVSAVNSLPAISTIGLSGTRKMSTSVNFSNLNSGGTVFIVGKQDSAGSSTDNFGCWLGAGGFINMQIERGSAATSGFGSLAGAIRSADQVETDSVVPEDTFITIRLRNDVDDNRICFNDGTEDVLASSGASYINSVLSLFRTASGAQGKKQIAEILIYARSLTTDEIGDIEDYLQAKYNHY